MFILQYSRTWTPRIIFIPMVILLRTKNGMFFLKNCWWLVKAPCFKPVVLKVWYLDEQHEHHLGTWKKCKLSPYPRQTESETLRVGSAVLQRILCTLQFENHCSKTVNSSAAVIFLYLILLNILHYKCVQDRDLFKTKWVPSCRSSVTSSWSSKDFEVRMPLDLNAFLVVLSLPIDHDITT